MDYGTIRTGVLVIGSGAAGLRAAIAARHHGADVVLVGKSFARDAHTILAAGGINGVMGTVDPEDAWQQHFADTWTEGYGLADPRTVELMTREAPAAIEELAGWGVDFARLPDGRLDQRFFGAHRYRRTCYAGDHTGREILTGLADHVDRLGIPIHDRTYVSRLLVDDEECVGAFAFDLDGGSRVAYLAHAVVLAAGGHTRLWRRSSSRAGENIGDGMHLALAAGAQLADMELVQFHPTGMVYPQSRVGTLVTEAVRGEGGRLFNALGERYMERYDRDRMELSTRDRVALANYTEIVEGRGGPHGGVFLDISHRDAAHIHERLPRMVHQFRDFAGIDITREPMEVAPTAHYTMGGVVVAPDTHTTRVRGLFAAGEVATGLHGANRLGGNSLAETVVFGRRAGASAAAYASEQLGWRSPGTVLRAAESELDTLAARSDAGRARRLERDLRDVMWRHCGVVRNAQGLATGLAKLSAIREAADASEAGTEDQRAPDPAGLAAALDLRAALTSGEATLRGAIERRESRGAHQRSDHPALDPDLTVNLTQEFGWSGTLRMGRRPVPPVPADLEPWLEHRAVAVAGRLLE